MKRILALVLISVFFCCAFVGCQKDVPETTNKRVPPTTERPRETITPYSPYLELGACGKERIEYTINLSNVKYITSADMLPDNECFSQYDEAYFRDHALLIVTETVNSGSVDVQIEYVKIDENIASVKLSHSGSGGVGTGDMAVWLLWAEVEQGLEYEWVVVNPAIDSNTSKT